MSIEQDSFFMKKAIELAKQGKGRTGLIPLSGAVLVKDGEIIGEGFYSNSSEHAEYNAIKAGKEKAEGSTLYVVVEPCFMKGKNNSCVDEIKNAGIKRVVVAMEDPNVLVKGKGLVELFEKKLEVTFGVEKEEATKLNEDLIKYYLTKTPFINMVTCSTLDGKIATVLGDREWIINDDSRNYLHDLRASYGVVITGVNTIIRDNPQFTSKIGRDPVKVIIDTYGNTPLNSKVFIKNKRDDLKPNVIIAVSAHTTEERIKALTAAGAEIVVCSDEKYDDEKFSKVDLKKLLLYLGKKGFTSALVEGGGNLNAGFIEENLVDKITYFITPKIIGGKNALSPIEGKGIEIMSQALELKNVKYTQLASDMMVEGYL
ncbi:MAG: bifunctional diaminohydroxyphosphoribosylaminopyrimidine deaminase/5-amino-6-(5-phosphoribosylamino)uracil reductase RibD [Candidatus Sericytochromatia bacterium]